MKKVLVLGAGMVTKPQVDYFLDKCGYEVIMATRTVSKAEKIIANRTNGRVIQWTTDHLDVLDKLVSEVDLVVSMIPPTMHIPVAGNCLRHQKNMVTTSYISPQMQALDDKAKEVGIIILNEIGEDPGIDHMAAKKMIDDIKQEGGKITSVISYGAGLPAFKFNRNPFGYKFSWSPRGVMLAAQASAAYLKEGKRIDVPSEKLFEHHWLVDIEGLGTFETYPNRDSTRYVSYFGLVEDDVTLYRGLLRFTGWCNTMRTLIRLNLLDGKQEKNFENMTYRDFTASLIGIEPGGRIKMDIATYLNLYEKDDIIKRLEWLGFFDDKPITIKSGANVDILVDLMLQKMSYQKQEQDMIIVHGEVTGEFTDRKEKRLSTLVLEGVPGGDSAMSRAVSLPAAIATRLILEEKITVKGIHMPTLPEIYNPVLAGLETFGFKFKHKSTQLS